MARRKSRFALALAFVVAASAANQRASAQAADPNGAPNPYRMLETWMQVPQDKKFGAPFGAVTTSEG